MYTVVPYRQANLVQVERVHKGSAQQPRSLETIFVFNESLSDHFIAFVSFDCCACFEHNSTSWWTSLKNEFHWIRNCYACFEHNSTSWWTSLKMNFIECEIATHALNTTRLHDELHLKWISLNSRNAQPGNGVRWSHHDDFTNSAAVAGCRGAAKNNNSLWFGFGN